MFLYVFESITQINRYGKITFQHNATLLLFLIMLSRICIKSCMHILYTIIHMITQLLQFQNDDFVQTTLDRKRSCNF